MLCCLSLRSIFYIKAVETVLLFFCVPKCVKLENFDFEEIKYNGLNLDKKFIFIIVLWNKLLSVYDIFLKSVIVFNIVYLKKKNIKKTVNDFIKSKTLNE